MLTTITRRINRLAEFLAWGALAGMMGMATMMLLLTSDWFTMLVASRNPGKDYTASTLIAIGPELLIIFGFIVVLGAMLGGFRPIGADLAHKIRSIIRKAH